MDDEVKTFYIHVETNHGTILDTFTGTYKKAVAKAKAMVRLHGNWEIQEA